MILIVFTISITIIIIISIITSIIAIIINSTMDDIWDMEELLAKIEEGAFTFYFLLHILLTGWIRHCSVL